MSEVKIMHLLLSLGTAGLQKQVVNIINSMEGVKGFKFSICCLEERGQSSYTLPDSCKIFVIGKRPGVAYMLPFMLTRLFRQEKVDILHTHGFPTQLYGTIAALLAEVPVVINGEHGDLFLPNERNPISYLARKLLSYFTKAIHTTSQDLKDNLLCLTGINKNKIMTIHNGVELDRFKKIPDARIRYKFFEKDDVVIGCLGRLEPIKNYGLLLEAFPKIKERIPKAKLFFVGDGPLRINLEAAAQKLGIEKNILFVGQHEDAAEMLNLMDIMVLPSVSEGLSNTILEAMACGIPVVASNVGGNPELVEDGITGFLFSSHDAEDLARKAIAIAKDADLRKAMSVNARLKAERDFSLERMLSDYRGLYVSLANRYINVNRDLDKENESVNARLVFKRLLLLPGQDELADSLVQEVAEYKNISPEEVHHWEAISKDMLNKEWEKRNSTKEFYATTEYYLYDLILFHSKFGGCKQTIDTLNFARAKGLTTILHFGAGVGTRAIIFAKEGLKMSLADISDTLLDFAAWRFKKRNISARFINLCREDLPRETFELVLSLDVFEHLEDPKYEIGRIHRSLKKGGYLFFNITTEKNDPRLMHVSSAKDILPCLRGIGFKKVHIGITSLHTYQKIDRPKILDLFISVYDAFVYYPIFLFISNAAEMLHIKKKIKEVMFLRPCANGAMIERYSFATRIVKNLHKHMPAFLRNRIAWARFNKNLNVWRRQYQSLDFPAIINLSLSFACQARCIYCPQNRGQDMKPVNMPFALAKKIIDEAAAENFAGKFRWSENGEALLNKDIIPVMEYFRKRLPENESCLVSNMDRLDKDMAKKLLSVELNELHLNIDGASKESYEYSKRGLSFERMKKNLHDFIELREEMGSSCNIHISILTAEKYLSKIEDRHAPFADDARYIIKYWRCLLRKTDVIRIVDFPYGWAVQDKMKIVRIYPCTLFSRAVDECFIAPNGDMYACCHDYLAKIVFGNVNEKSIKEIWNAPERDRFLRLLEEGKFSRIGEPCVYCLT